MRSIYRLAAITTFAFAVTTTSLSPAAGAMAWEPPPGYVFLNTYFGGSAGGWCDQVGIDGVQNGQWTAYLCHDVMRKHADIWFLYGDLYVKNDTAGHGH
ncbi:hypothetical protein [Nonomuraea rubra]|uniref:hypothetical protein n=1 Tax=Nonomuraea rubra TaxID=46180 RepID=UPI0033C69C91